MSRCDDGGGTRGDVVKGWADRFLRRGTAGRSGGTSFTQALSRSRPRLVIGVAVAMVFVLAGSAAAWAIAGGGAPVTSASLGLGGVSDNNVGRPVQSVRPEVVTLITGDRVHLVGTPGGLRVGAIEPSPGAATPAARSFARFSLHGDQFVVPVSALPYLGNTLDPALFDVDLLARLGNTTLPVKITGSTTSAPGIHVHRGPVVGGAVQASIDKSALKAWGRQIAASTAAVLSPGARTRTPAFPFGIQHIGLAAGPGSAGVAAGGAAGGVPAGSGLAGPAASLAASATPSPLRMHTLNVRVAGFVPGNPAGDLVAALLWVQNVNALNRFNDIQVVTGSDPVFALSVPEGNYSVGGLELIAPTSSDPRTHLALVAAPQISVSADTSVALNATRTQTVTASVTGGPAVPVSSRTIIMTRTSATGGADSIGAQTIDPAIDLRAQPSPPVTVGKFNFAPWFIYGSNGDGATVYNLFCPGSGIPANLSYTTPFADLSREVDKFYSAQPQSLVFTQVPFATQWAVAGGTWWFPFSVPAQEINYFNPGSGTDWTGTAVDQSFSVAYLSALRQFQAGEDTTQEWFKAPMRPGVQEESIAAPPPEANTALSQSYGEFFPCPACRQDDNLFINLRPFGDSQPGHRPQFVWAGQWAQVTSSTDFYVNGTLVDHRALPEGILPLSPAGTAYQLRWDLQGTNPYGEPGAHTTTTWTFRSAEPAPSTMPSFESCVPDPTRGCSYVPFIFLRYQIPLSLSDAATVPGPITLTIDAEHQGGDTVSPAVTSASLAISYDGGKTWAQVPGLQDQGNGQFTAVIDQPALSATNGFASLKVEATDAAGNQVDQTIINAYSLASQS